MSFDGSHRFASILALLWPRCGPGTPRQRKVILGVADGLANPSLRSGC